MSNDICPHCGQRVLKRMGVALTPKQADLFDMIKRGHGYIDQIMWVLFPCAPSKRAARDNLKVHVWGINERLAETDFKIKSDRDGRYVLERHPGNNAD